ncbi:MAG: hypothetical protein C0401_04055, partial [Anaerolinea sp.]|nr:hypothetical protein [Anaerolinea sp.]
MKLPAHLLTKSRVQITTPEGFSATYICPACTKPRFAKDIIAAYSFPSMLLRNYPIKGMKNQIVIVQIV